LPKIIIAGCGFLGEAAADFFSSQGWSVLGLCSSASSAERLAAKPYPVQVADIRQPLHAPSEWLSPEILIHCASSRRGGAEAYQAVYVRGLENLMQAFRPQRTIFTSSTSVYAQIDGEWVTEDAPTDPSRETGRLLLSAEQIALSSGGLVARLSGLYGPGRSVLLRKYLSRQAVLEKGGERWINQIHRDDAAAALFQLAESPAGIYNVTDNTPATQKTVYQWMADYFNQPLPPEGEPDLNRKRGWTSKRVANAKLRHLGWLPQFPSYREALLAHGLDLQAKES
jgi:nucleoside-diphosphate-sugar epimerase